MDKYEPQKIEPKWQKYWEKHPELNAADDKSSNKKKYILDMFPYPSGDGLHVGHVESYTATDIVSRYLIMNGKNVLHPTGWDAFGLPAENYAIKTKIHPAITTQKAIATFKSQMKKLGLSYDWSREINSSDPDYYRWTQWFFLLLYKNGYAYRAKAKVNYCPKCQTVLANEQVISGKCERCETKVVQKDLEQWFFRITDFIEDFLEARPPRLPDGQVSTKTTQRGRASATPGLLSGLDKIDWPESTKAAQRNWIGRSEGAIIKFPVVIASEAKQSRANNSGIAASPSAPRNDKKYLEVFTTRLDTIYGCTYCVVAPEHEIISNLKSQISNLDEVENYLIAAQNKTELERMESKIKTGVEIKGIKAINPFNNEEIPLFIADYVLGHYGTGAVMAVPAHDERDFEFAKKYNLPIRQSITPDHNEYNKTIKTLNVLKEIQETADKKDIKVWLLGGLAIPFYSQVIYRGHNDLDLIAKDDENLKKAIQLFKELGFKKIGEKKISESLTNFVYKKDDIEIDIGPNQGEFGLSNDFEEDIKPLGEYKSRVLSERFIRSFKEYQLKNRGSEKDKIDWEYLSGKVSVDDGFLVNSEKYSGMTSEKAREEMVKWLEKNNLGSRKINYKLRDWLVSRQRYWGAPIPIIYCPNCHSRESGNPETGSRIKSGMTSFKNTEIDGKKYAIISIPEEHLPVLLPDDVDFNPTGESPLIKSKKFHNAKCPICGAKARRESDTMDTFVCSSWYYFRYADPKNSKVFADKEKIKKWLPVDLYVGGAEHTVLHLLYSRFFTKALHKLGYIDFDEPFLKLRHQGTILGEDNYKMSKSRGNIVNPDDVINQYGADVLRMFEMFMGPLEDTKPWNTKGIVGIKRFLEKIWRLQESVIASEAKQSRDNNSEIAASPSAPRNDKIERLLHKTIKKVTEDIENLRFNTAISQMMILANEFDKQKEIYIIHYTLYLILLSPFAPHISEELWQKLGHKESIFKEKWPKYDPKLIKDEEIDLVIQVNGRVRDTIKVNADISEDEAKKLALKSEKVKKITGGKEVKKTIFIKGKLINLVA